MLTQQISNSIVKFPFVENGTESYARSWLTGLDNPIQEMFHGLMKCLHSDGIHLEYKNHT